jgi:FkbM family methyltransferase
MYQFIYDQSILRNKYRWRFFNLLRIHLSKFYDPDVRYTLHGHRISLPFSHPLPIFLKIHPLYSNNLTRLAGFIRAQNGHLKMIDVGANVGDSYCSVDPRSGDAYLLIEGERRFFALLTSNTRHDPSVEREFALLAEKDFGAEDVLVVQDGNASLQRGSSKSVELPAIRTTLERVMESHPQFPESNLLKVDVEGYDGRVLMGGRKYLAKTKPVIFFEYHPKKLADLGEDDLQIFQKLAELRYSSYIVYDNLGYWLGELNIDDITKIHNLAGYARQRGLYYDICCFHDTQKTLKEKFLQKEGVFYREYIRIV